MFRGVKAGTYLSVPDEAGGCVVAPGRGPGWCVKRRWVVSWLVGGCRE